MITSIDLRRQVLDSLPDYGLDEVITGIRHLMGIGRQLFDGSEATVRVCGGIALDTLREADEKFPDRSVGIWPHSGLVLMTLRGDRIAREALEALFSQRMTGESFLGAPQPFLKGAVAFARSLIRFRRQEIRYDTDSPEVREWARANPIVGRILAACDVPLDIRHMPGQMPPKVRRTAYMYLLD